MNEAGLVANILYLGDTQYEPRNGQRVSRICSGASSVGEALADLQTVQVVPVSLMATSGRCIWPSRMLAVIQRSLSSSTAGRSCITEKEFTVMTNEPPPDVQLENIKKYKLVGGTRPLPGDIDPESRFVRAASYLKTLPKAASAEAAMADVQSISRNLPFPEVPWTHRAAKQKTPGRRSGSPWPIRRTRPIFSNPLLRPMRIGLN
jgi:choloylglycine hydrolase